MGKKFFVKRALLLFAVLLLTACEVKEVHAAQHYEMVRLPVDNNKPQKFKGYYFMENNNGTATYVSSKKKGKYKLVIDEARPIYTNGKKVYYIKKGTLYEYKLSTGQRRAIRTFPKGSDYWLTASYGQNLYFSRSYIDKEKIATYSFNTKTGKVKKIKKSLHILDQEGKYILATPNMIMEWSNGKTNSLYEIKPNGLHKLWTLPEDMYEMRILDKNVYYYMNSFGEKAELFCYDIVTGEIQSVFSYERENEDQSIFMGEIGDKYCTIIYETYRGKRSPKAKVYKYVYKTGKLKRAPSLDKDYN